MQARRPEIGINGLCCGVVLTEFKVSNSKVVKEKRKICSNVREQPGNKRVCINLIEM